MLISRINRIGDLLITNMQITIITITRTTTIITIIRIVQSLLIRILMFGSHLQNHHRRRNQPRKWHPRLITTHSNRTTRQNMRNHGLRMPRGSNQIIRNL